MAILADKSASIKHTEPPNGSWVYIHLKKST